ncbi:hypothetical protein MLD38_039291 [Melastoma candidum]|uniref:Uncharacterized protein n=2 Tax=Melastoma candidum TaxID=119954 RepID=A0ACB9L1X4_9MYRT|nr:hypothetical protein MLD38_039287 [Melastoma candidum]KAI4303691.1 hypothetical protein MLD38_039291 [Melastoma candidum]
MQRIGFMTLVGRTLQDYDLPDQTPPPLFKYREEELMTLRGDRKGELREWDRVSDYAYYNDLGNPVKGLKYAKPVLGGSAEFPYPCRGRTGRPPSKSDKNTKSRILLLESLKIYVPRDERFGHIKLADFLAFGAKSIGQFLKPELEDLLEGSPKEFNSFRDIIHLYRGGIEPSKSLSESIQRDVPLEVVKEILPTEGEGILEYPSPQVIERT